MVKEKELSGNLLDVKINIQKLSRPSKTLFICAGVGNESFFGVN